VIPAAEELIHKLNVRLGHSEAAEKSIRTFRALCRAVNVHPPALSCGRNGLPVSPLLAGSPSLTPIKNNRRGARSDDAVKADPRLWPIACRG
jgi:hypothetical protein